MPPWRTEGKVGRFQVDDRVWGEGHLCSPTPGPLPNKDHWSSPAQTWTAEPILAPFFGA